MRKIYFILLSLLSIPITAVAQEDLLNSLEKDLPTSKALTVASFKGTRLINLHTVETLGKGSLDFRISHRFGDFSTGANNLWGLDGPATLRLGFDYAVTDRFTIGIGRSSYGKMFDGFLKYRLLRQTQNNDIPLSMSAVVSMNITSEIDPNKSINGFDRYEYFSSRISYFSQLMFARKFGDKVTIQISPIWIHYNLVQNLNDKNDMFSLGGSGKFKITRSLSLTGEYVLRVSKYTVQQSSLYHNTASIGIDIETGGHVFQVFVTNSNAINEVQVIPYTSTSWSKGQIRLGFNISRVFGIGKYKKSQQQKNKEEKVW
ncbi:MAG: hypothetical protein H7282_12000 [Cytophagaceae bacterium]|nr:hypothetical protein [Cytophagaceae bacterium]